MDHLEKAILFSFDESGTVDPIVKSQAVAICNRVREDPSICCVCIQRLSVTKFVQVQFWCFQALHDALRLRYPSIPSDQKSYIRDSLLSLANPTASPSAAPLRIADSQPFIKNKLAQVLVTLICLEYPMVWSSVFLDLLARLADGGPPAIDMFCRVLSALDDELISLDYPRSPEESSVACRVKDAMRQQCVPQIVRAWYDIVSLYKSSDPDLCSAVLDTMRRYVTWIDIALVANDTFGPLLFDLILCDSHPDHVRAASAGVLLAVVSKRMDPHSKLSLLRTLRIHRLFNLLAAAGDSNSVLVTRLADFVAGYAVELLECSNRLDSADVKGVSTKLLDDILPTVFYVMQNCELDTTFNIVQFLSSYVSTMKSLSLLREKQVVHIRQMLEVVRARIIYNLEYRDHLDLPDQMGREEEERMNEYRKDLFVLLRTIGRVAPDVTQIFVRNLLATALGSSEMNVEDVEAALSLFYALGESISEEGMRTGTGLLGEMIPMLLSARFSCHSYRLVALVYLETVTRYVKFVQENTQYITLVLAAFLDDRGIHHPNLNVSRRASYLFMRVVKLLKAKLLPFMETILQSLQDTVIRFTSLEWTSKELKCSGSEDGSHIFEAIGLLIGMEDVSPEKQSEYLSALLTPLCQQVEFLLLDLKRQNPEDSSDKIANIQQLIMAINALSKGFSERLVTTSRPGIGIMFKQTLDVLLRILVVFPKVEPLRNKVTSFLHRMVDTLGASVFPYLPKALEQLLADSEPKEMFAFLVLINQLICKFNTSVGDIMEEIFPAIAGRVFHMLPSDAFPLGPGGNTEEIRELQELQRISYTFLYDIVRHGLSAVLLAPKSRGYLDRIMRLLLHAACKHKDMLVRKTSVQIFVRLIKDWCTHSNGEEKVPGFRSFIIENFGINCCLYSVLDKSFEFRDANTHILFGEIVMAQTVLYEKFGNDFLVQFVSKAFPAAHCPQNLAEEYCQKLQGGDFTSLKSFYQTLVQSLRCQQNGSLGR